MKVHVIIEPYNAASGQKAFVGYLSWIEGDPEYSFVHTFGASEAAVRANLAEQLEAMIAEAKKTLAELKR